MGMHTTILGAIALVAAVVLLVMQRYLAAAGLLLVGLTLGFSFLILIKSLPVDFIGVGLTILFAAGCALLLLALRRPAHRK